MTVTVGEDDPDRSALQPDVHLYPDLASTGSLATALVQTAERTGVDLDIRSPGNGRERLI